MTILHFREFGAGLLVDVEHKLRERLHWQLLSLYSLNKTVIIC